MIRTNDNVFLKLTMRLFKRVEIAFEETYSTTLTALEVQDYVEGRSHL